MTTSTTKHKYLVERRVGGRHAVEVLRQQVNNRHLLLREPRDVLVQRVRGPLREVHEGRRVEARGRTRIHCGRRCGLRSGRSRGVHVRVIEALVQAACLLHRQQHARVEAHVREQLLRVIDQRRWRILIWQTTDTDTDTPITDRNKKK